MAPKQSARASTPNLDGLVRALAASINSPAVVAPVPVVIVDDDRPVRMSLEQLLRCEPSYVCVGAYDRGRSALAGISRTGATMVLMDIRMPGMSGIECTQRLLCEVPESTVVMVTAACSQEAIRDSIQAGCRGYLVKPFSVGQLWSELACALGRAVMNPRLIRPQFCFRKLTGQEHCPRLSPHQHAVLQHVATGLNQKEVAEALKCTRDSVEQALKRAYRKYGVKNCAGVLPLMASCQACRFGQEAPKLGGGGLAVFMPSL